jgi:DNA-binding NarL/FixJ family response regulator
MVSSPPGNCPDASQDDLKGDSEMNHHDLITAPLAKFSSQVLPRGRRIKFTPERIQQIRNLVERGKSREEIAELIEVTVGSLQVTCSKLGISLRRPREPLINLRIVAHCAFDSRATVWTGN